MTKEERQQLKTDFKNREIIGGVFAIINTENNTAYISSSLNMNGSKNRFDFCKINNACVHPRLQKEWDMFGSASFAFEILEHLSKKDEQSDNSFKSDLELLTEIYLENLKNNYKFVGKL